MKLQFVSAMVAAVMMTAPMHAQQSNQKEAQNLAKGYWSFVQQGQNNQNVANVQNAMDAYRNVLLHGKEGPAYWIGVHCQPSEETSMHFKSEDGNELIEFVVEDGLKVVAVLDESPAAKAGLEADDVIFMIENEKIKTIPQMSKVVASKKGDPVELVVVRDKKLRQFNIKPQKRGEKTFLELTSNAGSLQRHLGLLQGQLPENITITLTKQGSKPAEFEVEEDGGETYIVTLAEVNEAPAAARPMIYRLGVNADGPQPMGAVSYAWQPAAPLHANNWISQQSVIIDKLNQISKKLDKLEKQLDD